MEMAELPAQLLICVLHEPMGIPERFYSMSSNILRTRKNYYDTLEASQKGKLDITTWLKWFLDCLSQAIESANSVLHKARVWEKLQHLNLNERQRKVINILLGNFQGNLTTSKYAKLVKCSQDTALRDIQVLMQYGVMVQSPDGGRSTHYQII